MKEVGLAIPSINNDVIFCCADTVSLAIKHCEPIHGDWTLFKFEFQDETELIKFKALLRLNGLPIE